MPAGRFGIVKVPPLPKTIGDATGNPPKMLRSPRDARRSLRARNIRSARLAVGIRA